MNFGNELFNIISPPTQITFTNGLTTSITVNSISVAPSDYLSGTNCPASLAAGASCFINLWFRPTKFGAIAGALSISHSATGSPITVPLAGNGVDVAFAFNRARRGARLSVNQTLQTLSQRVVFDAELSATGNVSLPLSLVCKTPAGTICEVTPATTMLDLHEGETQLVPVQVTVRLAHPANGLVMRKLPIAAGEYKATVTAFTANTSKSMDFAFTVSSGASRRNPRNKFSIPITAR